jgi:hypothetical protein
VNQAASLDCENAENLISYSVSYDRFYDVEDRFKKLTKCREEVGNASLIP